MLHAVEGREEALATTHLCLPLLRNPTFNFLLELKNRTQACWLAACQQSDIHARIKNALTGLPSFSCQLESKYHIIQCLNCCLEIGGENPLRTADFNKQAVHISVSWMCILVVFIFTCLLIGGSIFFLWRLGCHQSWL